MNEEIIVYTTEQIDDALWQQIVDGFNESFHTNHDIAHFKKYYTSNSFGHSFHAIKLSEEGELMGYNSYIPSEYIFKGEKIKAVNSGGSFVLKKFRREEFLFMDLLRALSKYSVEHGFTFSFGVPNKNSFKYSVKFLRANHIGDLPYYMLPVNISKILKKSNLSFLDLLSRIYCYITVYLNIILSAIFNKHNVEKDIELSISPDFLAHRFENKTRYKELHFGNETAYYRMIDEDGISTAYIMYFGDLYGKRSYKSLAKCVKEILKNEKVDIILYVGTMNMKQMLLTRVPSKLEPQKLHLVYNIIDKTQKKSLSPIYNNIKNWDFSLINFDAR